MNLFYKAIQGLFLLSITTTLSCAVTSFEDGPISTKTFGNSEKSPELLFEVKEEKFDDYVGCILGGCDSIVGESGVKSIEIYLISENGDKDKIYTSTYRKIDGPTKYEWAEYPNPLFLTESQESRVLDFLAPDITRLEIVSLDFRKFQNQINVSFVNGVGGAIPGFSPLTVE